MSLPDTVFIFVLALIIFGPKKLPEIGRQLGKLVGEFRRASNEFKFQIEEELRQAESAERNATPAKKELETTASAETSTEPPDSTTPDSPYPEETLPVGQYPNIDTINTQNLGPTGLTESEALPGPAHEPGVGEELFHPEFNPAVGAEPRTTSHYSTSSANEPESPGNDESFPASGNSPSKHEPVDPHAAPAVADITHG